MTLNVDVTPETIELMREAIEAGDYSSKEDVVRQAMQYWTESRALETQDLNHAWREATEGPQESHDPEPILDRLEAKYRAMSVKSRAA